MAPSPACPPQYLAEVARPTGGSLGCSRGRQRPLKVAAIETGTHKGARANVRVCKGLTLDPDCQQCPPCLFAGDVLPCLIRILNPLSCLAVQLPVVRRLHPPDGERVCGVPNLVQAHVPCQKPPRVRGPWPQDKVLGEGEDLLSVALSCSLKTVPANREMCVLGSGLGHLAGELHRLPFSMAEDLGHHGSREGVCDH